MGCVIHGVGFKLNLASTEPPIVEEDEGLESDVEGETLGLSDGEKDNEKTGHCTFSPAIYCDAIVKMMEKHYCTHPLIPGYGHPNAEGIKHWAVQSMYNFCVKHK